MKKTASQPRNSWKEIEMKWRTRLMLLMVAAAFLFAGCPTKSSKRGAPDSTPQKTYKSQQEYNSY